MTNVFLTQRIMTLLPRVRGGGGGGILGIEMIEWEQNSRPKKSQGLSTKTEKIPGPKINAKKSHAEFLTLKILNIKNIRDTLVKHPRRLPLIVISSQNYAAKVSNTKKNP